MKKVFIETYGCQMNQADSGIVGKILSTSNYSITMDENEADIILINTCAVRDNAEKRIHNRLHDLNALRKKKSYLKVGIIGCMAERLKDSLINEDRVDIVAGPDSYRKLPELIKESEKNNASIDVNLSEDETYQDIIPMEINSNNITAFISIMRGCENFCSYCVVPYTRGKERSRDPKTIVEQAKNLFDKGYRDITLLGQNVNSYIYNKGEGEKEVNFARLMAMVAQINP